MLYIYNIKKGRSLPTTSPSTNRSIRGRCRKVGKEYLRRPTPS